MRLTYKGTEPAWVPSLALTVQPGETVDVPDELADSFLSHPVWAKAKPAKEVTK